MVGMLRKSKEHGKRPVIEAEEMHRYVIKEDVVQI